jgi:hypothetical protein
MNRAVRVLVYLIGSFAILIGLATFGYGLFVPVFVAESYLFMGALFFIGGIVVIWLAARTRKPKTSRQGAWRTTLN